MFDNIDDANIINLIKRQKGLLIFHHFFLLLLEIFLICVLSINSIMFNKESEYALRSLVYIQLKNYQNQKPGIEEIVREIEAPHHFTAKILQRLVKYGFIKSTKGKGGGFYFDLNVEDLSLKNVILVIEGNKLFDKCGFGLATCDCENPCPVHDKYEPIRKAVNELVEKETIQSLAQKTTMNLKSFILKQ